MRLVLSVFAAVLVAAGVTPAADPPKFTVESKLEPRFVVIEKDVNDLKARLDALEGKTKAAPVKGWECGCVTFKDRCTCGPACTCLGTYGVSADAKADVKKGPPNPNPTIRFGARWMTWDGYEWKDAGPYNSAESANPPAAPVKWDCSSGVCRPVSGGATYSAPVYSGGGCSGGNCSPAAYGVPYGSFGGVGGFRPFGGGGGSCGPGGCR